MRRQFVRVVDAPVVANDGASHGATARHHMIRDMHGRQGVVAADGHPVVDGNIGRHGGRVESVPLRGGFRFIRFVVPARIAALANAVAHPEGPSAEGRRRAEVVLLAPLPPAVGAALRPRDPTRTMGIHAEGIRVARPLHVNLRLHDRGVAIGRSPVVPAGVFPDVGPVLPEVAGGNRIPLFGIVGLDAEDAAAQVGGVGRAHGRGFIVAHADVQVAEIVETHGGARMPAVGVARRDVHQDLF